LAAKELHASQGAPLDLFERAENLPKRVKPYICLVLYVVNSAWRQAILSISDRLQIQGREVSRYIVLLSGGPRTGLPGHPAPFGRPLASGFDAHDFSTLNGTNHWDDHVWFEEVSSSVRNMLKYFGKHGIDMATIINVCPLPQMTVQSDSSMPHSAVGVTLRNTSLRSIWGIHSSLEGYSTNHSLDGERILRCSVDVNARDNNSKRT
jgi:hypothetical protein